MKWLFIMILVLCVIALLLYIMMAIQSQKQPDRFVPQANLEGHLHQGLLYPCPNSPNCVCSESHSQSSSEHAVSPIKADEHTWNGLKNIILQQGGSIEQDDGTYLHATFSSALFHFVDDVELRSDVSHGLIQIRSASRAGRSDFGVNRKRVELIKQALIQAG